jgi:hypothetical protein
MTEAQASAIYSLPWPAFDRLHAQFRAGGKDEGPEFDAEFARLRDSHPAGVGDWDDALEALVSSGVPMQERRAGQAPREFHPSTLEQSRSFRVLREAGIPVDDVAYEGPVQAEEIVEAIVDHANSISPIPLKPAVDSDGNVTAGALEAMIELADDLRAGSDANLLEGVGAMAEAQKIREAAAARRGAGRIR